MLTFLGPQGDRVLLLILLTMVWLSSASALEFVGLAQRTNGWARLRSLFWGSLLLTVGIMVAQSLGALPVLIGGNIPLGNRLTFFLGGTAALALTSFYALHLLTRPSMTVWCIVKSSIVLTAGQYVTTLLIFYQLLPVREVQIDLWLAAASVMVAVATKTGTFAIVTTSAGTLQRLFAGTVLTVGLAGSRFLLIIGATGVPTTGVAMEADRLSLFALGLHASPAMMMIGSVIAVTVMVGLAALMLTVRPWRANRDLLRSHRAQDMRRRLAEVDTQRQTLEDRLTDMTRQRDLALSDRVRILASVQSAQATLNQEIAQRRQILDEHRQLLERQARQHGTFVATAVHETRHMIQAILADLTRLADPIRAELTPDQKKLLTRMSDQSDHLLGLLCTLSDYARLQGPLQPLPLRPVPAMEVLGRLRNTLDPVARDAGLHIDWPNDLAMAGVALHTDSERLYQILAELIRNAMRFNRPGGSITLMVETLPPVGMSNPEQRLRLVVADTGIGIAPDLAASLFQPFARRPASMPLGPEIGIGLSLAIAQRLAESLNSRIAFASEPGIGSRFWLDIATAGVPLGMPVIAPLAQARAFDYPTGSTLKAAQ